MKKQFLSLGIILFSMGATAQINVPEVQKSLYGSVDATWCGNCGNVGIPTTASIYSQVNDKAIFFELHASTSSALHSQTAEALSDEFGVASYPSVTLNGVLKGALNGSIESQLVDEITNNYDGSSAQVNAGFEWKVEGDSISVTTNTKFFEELTGEFYTGVYISQDSIWEYQANYNPNIPNGNIYHFHILRDVLSENIHGVQTGMGTIAADTEIEKVHKIKINSEWDLNNIHINTVVWEKSGSSYTFKNANNTGTLLTSNLSVEDYTAQVELDLFPNPGTDLVTLSSENQKLKEVYLTDNLGRVIQTYSVEFVSELQINISGLANGIYYVSGQTEEGGNFNKRLIKQ